MITSNEISMKIDAVFTNIFFMIENKKYVRQLSKSILIDDLATNVNECLFNRLLGGQQQQLVYLWHMSSHMCSASRKYLLNEKSLRHDYFTFNNLLIDKIEEFLAKLVAKLDKDKTNQEQKSLSPSVSSCSSFLPNYHLDIGVKPAKISMYSIFFLEIWMHVYVGYFRSVFLKCGRLGKLSRLAAKNNKLVGKKKLRNFSLLDSIRSFNVSSSERVLQNEVKINGSSNTLVDLSLFKKLISLIQKVTDF